MSQADEDGNEPKPVGRWHRLWQVPSRPWLLGIPLGAMLAFAFGAVSITGFIAAVESSSTETFCISCHEMGSTVYPEYKETIHYSNRSGVRATCSDCHVPKAWVPKLIRKIDATFKEVPQHFLGKINTPEKFEAHRAEMAQSVWDSMKASDSRECRNCHEIEHMDPEEQGKRARKKHDIARMQESGETCIDCHKGIAHRLPKVEMGAEVSPVNTTVAQLPDDGP